MACLLPRESEAQSIAQRVQSVRDGKVRMTYASRPDLCGWGYGIGLVDHQVALLVRGCTRVSVAVLTMHDGDHAYGKETLEGMFSRLLRGLPTGANRRPA